MAIGSLVLLGWVFSISWLKNLLPGLVEMKANAALGFVAAGAALYLMQPDGNNNRRVKASRALSLAVLLLGGLTLAEYLLGVNLGIDELLFDDTLTNPLAFPGRMATPTALNFFLIGMALWLLSLPSMARVMQVLCLIVGGFGTLAMLGYIYNVASLYTLYQNNPMALHTAFSFVCLCLGTLFVNPDRGFMRLLSDPGTGGITLRRLLTVAVIVPVFLGWIIFRLEDAGLQDTAISLALYAVLTIAAMGFVIWRNAGYIVHVDSEKSRTQAQFKAIFDEALDVILLVDGRDSTILKVNHVVRRVLGYEPDALISSPFSIFFPPKAEENQKNLAMKLRSEGHAFLSQEFIRADGTTCMMDLTAAVIPWETDRAVLVTLRDVTERKALQEELLRSERLRVEMEKERELTQLKEDFITMVSHDFRTPLAVILTSYELLERYRDRLTEDGRDEQLRKIRDQVYYMTDLLDDVLVLGQARSRKLKFNPTPLNLRALCQSTLDEVQSTGGDKHRFYFEADGLFDEVSLDEKLIHRILANLLANAVKYSPKGGAVRLQIRRESHEIVLCVADEGIGIPEKDRARLFEPFHRGGNTSGIKGTGLGLAIVYESVRLHGGSISVDSHEGKGSIFIVRLPVG
ncbi:MAG: PAS domain-containing sensor histidine kinase [Anaerolineae bacterium]|nr:PAS domain-containing sensor histidine kinase [Anaerolineae bacterium]